MMRPDRERYYALRNILEEALRGFTVTTTGDTEPLDHQQIAEELLDAMVKHSAERARKLLLYLVEEWWP